MNSITPSKYRLSASEVLRLEEICDRFEAAWKSGQRPRLEEFLPDQSEPARAEFLYELLQVELRFRRRADEQPTLDEYRPRFPQDAELLAEVFAAGLEMAQSMRSLDQVDNRPETGRYVSQGALSTLASLPTTTPRDLPEVPGHELLEVLGIGGNCIVYKARHLKLKQHLVAVKMLRPDRPVTPETLTRFRTDAEALARLKHPNIAQIHEVGEHNGLPYFSMELAEGSLAQKLDLQPKPASTGELVEKLARAMHYAHERQILHRDLKPHNVLLTADGTPKITDFGLAKILDQDAGPTVSGQIFGTPQYMAPEQAAAKREQIGPATDVYALGVILYEMLTGRPPFHGNETAVILLQVLEETPIPPRRLVPKLHRDLETICLKCLEKEPRKRYRSALALAEDLHRFLNNESIIARPTPSWERAWKSAKRRPALASASGVLIVAVLVGLVGHYLALNTALAEALAGERQAQASEKEANLDRILTVAEAALEKRNWEAARDQAVSAQTQAGDDPRLNGLRDRAGQLLAQIDQRRNDLNHYAQFVKLRDEVLFYTTQFTGLDKVTNLQRAIAAAKQALKVYGVTPNSTTPATLQSDYLTGSQQCEIRAGCYELLLIWADAVAQLADPTKQASAELALCLLNQAARFEFDTQVYHHRHARYLDQVGDALGAAWHREIAKQPREDNAIDFFLRGIDAYRDREPKQAIREFRRVLSLQQDHYGALYSLAVCHLTLASSDRASAHSHVTAANGNLNGCISRYHDYIWPYLLRGYAHTELEEFEAAEADFRQADVLEQHNPDDVARYGILVNRGLMRIRQKKLDQAIVDLQAAVERKPSQYQAYHWLARAYQDQGLLNEALLQLNQAIALKPPTLAVLHLDRAKLHRLRNDSAAALRDLKQMIQPDLLGKRPALRAEDHLQRGRLWHQLKQYDEAVRAYDDAIQLQPDNPSAFLLRGEALLELRQYKDAVQALDLYFVPYMRDAQLLARGFRARGQASMHLAKHADGVADYTRALAIEPNNAKLHAACGWAHVTLEAYHLAQVNFENVVKLEPTNGNGHNGLGYAQVKLGDYKNAVIHAKTALQCPEVTYQTCYNAARIYAQAANAGKDTSLTGIQRGDRRSEYERKAVELLQQAHDLQPAKDGKAFMQYVLSNDAALVPLYQCNAFKELKNKYGKPTIPAKKPEAIQ